MYYLLSAAPYHHVPYAGEPLFGPLHGRDARLFNNNDLLLDGAIEHLLDRVVHKAERDLYSFARINEFSLNPSLLVYKEGFEVLRATFHHNVDGGSSDHHWSFTASHRPRQHLAIAGWDIYKDTSVRALKRFMAAVQ